MKHFGTKRIIEIDADAVAAERLMAIASRFKTGNPLQQNAEQPVSDGEAPEALDSAN